jgi:hypothetical protein
VPAVSIDGKSGELSSRRLSGVTAEVVVFCSSLPRPTRVAYEAGPTGYGLSRALGTVGLGCVVAAPGTIERPPVTVSVSVALPFTNLETADRQRASMKPPDSAPFAYALVSTTIRAVATPASLLRGA